MRDSLTQPAKTDRPFRLFLIGVLLVGITFAAYWHALGGDFITYLDDGEYITRNAHIQSGLNWETVKWAFTSAHSANWHPLTWISHAADISLYGLMPSGHHLTNVLLHAANALLLFLVLLRMTGSTWRSAFAAALFALHPLHVESVAWISERKDLLSTFFWFLTILAYAGYSRKPGIGRYLLVAFLFAMGLLSKPMVVTLPLTLLVLDYWPLRRSDQLSVISDQLGGPKHRALSTKRLVLEKVPLFALSGASCVATVVAQGQSGAIVSTQDIPLWARLGNAVVSYVSYILNAIWPTGLSVLYPHPRTALPAWEIAGALVVLVAITVVVVRTRVKHPYALAGWAWYVVTLIPVIGLVQVGSQASADRYTYVPLVGLFWLVVWWAPDRLLSRARGRRALGLAAVVILAALAVSTCQQTKYWRNSITLLQRAVDVADEDYDTLNMLGAALAEAGQYEKALRCYEEVRERAPQFADVYSNLGIALASMDRLDEAVIQYRTAVKLQPEKPETHYNLGKVLSMMGRHDEAIAAYKTSLDMNPDNAEVHNNLGNAYLRKGDLRSAEREYLAALEIDPNLAAARSNLESLPRGSGSNSASVADSIRHYNRGVELQNEDRTDEAVAEYEAALKLRPDYAQAHNNLALAYMEKGDFAAAWKEVHLCRKYGLEPHPGLIEALKASMPEPR